MKKNLLLLILILFALSSFQSPLFAYDDWTLGPVVNTISGPTTGVLEQEYTFSTTVSATGESLIKAVYLVYTTNPDIYSLQEGAVRFSFQEVADGLDTCTTSECSITGTFNPPSLGTYYIFISVSFYQDTENDTATACNTHPDPGDIEATCLDSGDKYITFVVEEAAEETTQEVAEETTLPQTSTVPTKTYILISTGLLLLLSSSQVRKFNFSYFKKKRERELERKRERIEENFN
jgi:hypothetical protein